MAINNQEQVDRLLNKFSREELLELIEYIAQRLRRVDERKPEILCGIWKGKFPEDADIDMALGEIRGQWREEFEGNSK